MESDIKIKTIFKNDRKAAKKKERGSERESGRERERNKVEEPERDEQNLIETHSYRERLINRLI